MDGILEGLVGAFFGAAALIISGILSESYKRHHDKRAIASAIAGEIFSILNMIARRGHIISMQIIATKLESNIPVKIPNIVGGGLTGMLDPVAQAHLDRLGLLTEDRLPERIAQFYTMLRGIRVDIVNLSRGVFDGDLKKKAGLIREDLAIWAVNETLGKDIYEELRKIVDEPWWLEAKWLALKRFYKNLMNI